MRHLGLLSLLCLVIAYASVSDAAEFSLYSKTGYMDWQEEVDGKRFIRENGPTEEIGVTGTAKHYGAELQGKLGGWGATFRYDGSSAETAEPRKMTTGNFGGKGEISLAFPVAAGAGVEIAPLVGTGIDYFRRSVGPETWLVLSAKAGARLRVGPVELLAGAMLPYRTTDTIDWTAIGASSKITVAPRGMVSPFVEAKTRTGRWGFSLFYEPMRWKASDKAPFTYNGQNPSAAIATATGLYQPQTSVQHLGISIEYRF